MPTGLKQLLAPIRLEWISAGEVSRSSEPWVCASVGVNWFRREIVRILYFLSHPSLLIKRLTISEESHCTNDPLSTEFNSTEESGFQRCSNVVGFVADDDNLLRESKFIAHPLWKIHTSAQMKPIEPSLDSMIDEEKSKLLDPFHRFIGTRCVADKHAERFFGLTSESSSIAFQAVEHAPVKDVND
jgi:hypothetical protein